MRSAGSIRAFSMPNKDGLVMRMSRWCLFALLILSGLEASAGSATGGREVPLIYFVTWRGCEEACRGFKDYFARERISVEILERDAAQDKTKLAGFVQEAKLLQPDLVLTWGTSVSLGMLGPFDSANPTQHISEIPAVFMIVSQPVDSKLVPNFDSSGRNITGTRYLVPEETQLNVAREYRAFRRLGVIYNPLEKNSVINVERLRDLAEAQDFVLLAHPLPLGRNGEPDAESIPGLVADLARAEVDWIYQGSDSYLVKKSDVLTGAAADHQVPVISAGEMPVRTSGALLGVVNRYYIVGQYAARQALRILRNDAAPEDIPIESPSRFSVIINMTAAQKLRLFPPMKMLKYSEVVVTRK